VDEHSTEELREDSRMFNVRWVGGAPVMFWGSIPMRINLSARTRATRSVCESSWRRWTTSETIGCLMCDWYRRVVDVLVYAHVLRWRRQDSETMFKMVVTVPHKKTSMYYLFSFRLAFARWKWPWQIAGLIMNPHITLQLCHKLRLCRISVWYRFAMIMLYNTYASIRETQKVIIICFSFLFFISKMTIDVNHCCVNPG
jgi:hypothetical protein